MKKRILVLLAVVALLVTCAVFSVQGLDGEAPAVLSTFVCPCSTCKTARAADPTYKSPAWSDWVSLPAGGGALDISKHYYVGSEGYTATAAMNFKSGTTVVLIDGGTVTLKNRGLNATSGNIEAHVIGNNGAQILATPSSSGSGAMMQIGGGGDNSKIHIYGDLTFSPKNTTNTGKSGYVKVYSGHLYIHGADGLGLTNTKAPCFNGINVTDGGYGDVFGIESSNGRIYLLDGTFKSVDTGAIWVNAGYLYVAGNANFVAASGSTAVCDIYRVGGNLRFTKEWCQNDNTGAVLDVKGDTLNKQGGYYGGQTKPNASGGTDYAWLDFGTLTQNADGTCSFSNQGVKGNVNTIDSGLTLYYPSHNNPPLYAYASTTDGSGFTTPRGELVINGQTAGWAARVDSLCDNYAASTATDKYIRVWGWQGNTITHDVCVDFNGVSGTSAWTINAGKTMYAFDSKATLDTAGVTLVTTGSGTVSPITVAPNGKTYAIAENTIYEVAVTAEINQVALRPTTAGMYFGAKATVTGLDAGKAVAEANLYTGVAVATAADAAFANTAWTATKGVTGNGILVNNILKDGADNATRTGTSIYAKACVTYGGKLVALGEEESLSMTGLMEKMDTAWAAGKLDNTQKQNLLGFYDAWAEVCGWNFSNIVAQ